MRFTQAMAGLCAVLLLGSAAARADYASHRDFHLDSSQAPDTGLITTPFSSTSKSYGLEEDIWGEPVEPDMEEVNKHPLGSEGNPVRVDMPAGERAYLNRLRCKKGGRPKYERLGSVSTLSPWGMIMDLYDVRCAKNKKGPKKFHIYMDMYHPDHKEDRPVPGFKIVRGR